MDKRRKENKFIGNRECCVYAITHILTNRSYIGVSVNPNKRWKYHKRAASAGKKPNYIYRALRKYGFDAFRWEILSKHSSEKLAKDEEIRLIAEGQGHFNMTAGGEGISNPPEEVRRKIGDKNRGRIKSAEEIAKTNLHKIGVPASEEKKALISRRQREFHYRKQLIRASGVYGPFPWVDYPENL